MIWSMILLVGFWPILQAWWTLRRSTLGHSLIWALFAWSFWCLIPLWPGALLPTYLALCLTACAGVAVLGARRPGVEAWNFVVAGLLLVLLRPLLEGFGELRLNGGHWAILITVLVVALGNYLPTRLGVAALAMAYVCAASPLGWPSHPLLVLCVPLLGWAFSRPTTPGLAGEWAAFRDRFGFAWAARQAEQFNAAAINAGLDARAGLWADGDDTDGRAVALLRTSLKRFEWEP